jgi:CRISPR/Cas system CSM-associated protein Csm2 small subunit
LASTLEKIDAELARLSVLLVQVTGRGKPERMLKRKIDELLDQRNAVTKDEAPAEKKSVAEIPKLGDGVPYGPAGGTDIETIKGDK